ncbi:MAG TPA: DNA-3-methyladenine glycosylase I [Anaerolineales bacterium]|nr:DNA-3-methyladenine glycosylase I [Anaerolineales bacterium]
MTTYCEYCNSHPEDAFNATYHNTQYGFPLKDDNLLYERLILEINQAGLSWITILKKADNFRQAYDGFDIEKVSKYDEKEVARLLADAGIIRNRLKINAAILNAQKILELRKEFGSFRGWLDVNRNLSKEAWIKLFRKTFVFTGGEIVNEFLMSTGYLPGAHDESCPIYKKVASLRPAWMRHG